MAPERSRETVPLTNGSINTNGHYVEPLMKHPLPDIDRPVPPPTPITAHASGGGREVLEFVFPGDPHPYTYEVIEQSSRFLLERTKHRPRIGIICGSGLGGLAELLKEKDVFPYEEIPNFPASTVPGHAGRMVIGLLEDVPVICMQGRFHCYEGYALWKCAMPVRVMKLTGVSHIIVTNAAGGLNPAYNVGDIMLLKDHINMQGFAGDSPLKGRNDERFGPRFPAMNNSYDQRLRQMAKQVAKDIGIDQYIREGVYVMLGGPAYETVAELRLLRMLGVDAVGMSTVPEVMVARHCGMTVFAFSLITNECITDYDAQGEANHEEVIETANKRQNDLNLFVTRVVSSMANEMPPVNGKNGSVDEN
ncbi:purine nucleoside phosphorylase-like isoform X1 [Daphnia carinata]|uniref:purine nucleoside phosphorylase-like isoform X1 n=1 Tax=Daphnia carinata TaxID=120202 RepID=UPI00257B6464|nr:purine nucleoside phosphorylase-like isoform X1 [Daphnia carinata]